MGQKNKTTKGVFVFRWLSDGRPSSAQHLQSVVDAFHPVGASAVQTKKNRQDPCWSDVFGLPCLWSDTCAH